MREDLGADLPYPLPTARYQKKVMHLLVKLNQAVEDLQAFNRRQESAALGIMELPPQATTIEEVRSLEDSLQSEEYRQKRMQSLTRIGGSNTKDNGKRIMEKYV
ncbi:uncharacterized protein [Argopecten irradians]|uniref:uncharacterized protein n=1 Tax=Argopecten irradians TaxID=31199 RepID=UPI003724577D